MKIKSAFIAAVIGFATVAGATAASAAPLGAPAIAAQTTVTEAGYGHRHGRGHGYHRRHYYKKHHAYYGKKCYKKRFKVWSHHHHGWVYKYKTVCYRGGHRY